jgi:hypothetical protein
MTPPVLSSNYNNRNPIPLRDSKKHVRWSAKPKCRCFLPLWGCYVPRVGSTRSINQHSYLHYKSWDVSLMMQCVVNSSKSVNPATDKFTVTMHLPTQPTLCGNFQPNTRYVWSQLVFSFCRRGLGNFLFTTASRMALGPTQPPIQWVPGALSLGVKRPGREADHSPPSSAEVKEWVELNIHSPNTPSWRGA